MTKIIGMKDRRTFIQKNLLGAGLLLSGDWAVEANPTRKLNSAQIEDTKIPKSIYINWASYDELSDVVKLTEDLAFKQLEALLKLKSQGVQFDSYLMDMFWFDAGGGYREWRKETWSATGPDRWLQKCKANNLMPGLWFSTNIMEVAGNRFLKTIPEWEDSLSSSKTTLCLFSGGYLKHLIGSLQMHYDKGVRVFKFDFASFSAATPEMEAALLPREIVLQNETVWRAALHAFRQKNSDAILLAYNGYGGLQSDTGSVYRKTVDTQWLQVFDSLYCGDPRPSDVPCSNFWRSKDIYSDHMVWQYSKNGIPLSRIDNTSFMIGKTGTCYNRGKENWKGMLVLSLARAGLLHTIYGDLTLLDATDADFFARTQKLYMELLTFGKTTLFGGVPGKAEVFGYLAELEKGQVLTVVNPSQNGQKVVFPNSWKGQKIRLLFSDAGYMPEIVNNTISLGAEQLAVVGFGKFADPKYDLGKGDNLWPIPTETKEIAIEFKQNGMELTADFIPTVKGKYRLLFQQFKKGGIPLRVSGGSKPGAKSLALLNKMEVSIEGKPIELQLHYDKIIWSGLSWAVGEFDIPEKLVGSSILLKYFCPDAQMESAKAQLVRVSF